MTPDLTVIAGDIARLASTIYPVSAEVTALRIQALVARMRLGDANTRLDLMAIAAAALRGVAEIDRASPGAAPSRPRTIYGDPATTAP